ncbi:MAG: hypothetical protein COY80_05330 [Candidatus Pacebacteria bacterium CG_4_10_14_0_8_um_filter_42_14]|nr:MAG: hypothetical protein COY80_05330 [Candidatus Pacebacteria bacterium CG_4_10_14_0_8_um_filter_42_14]
MKYKYLLFDWDGCLAKTAEVWLDAYVKVFATYGVNPTLEEIVSKVFGDWEGPAKLGIPDNDEFFEKMMPIIDKGIETVGLYPGAKEMLEESRARGARIALVSSSVRRHLDMAFANNEIKDYFEIIISGEDVEKHKPDPEVIYKALDFFKADKSEAVIIGDTKSDLLAGKNAGIDSILFYPESHKILYDKKTLLEFQPTHVISELGEILDLLNPQ